MTTWKVISPDMWGHVHADCTEDCPCGGPDADCCDHCGEWENNRFAAGSLETADDADDAAIIAALVDEGFLHEKAKGLATVDDYSDGFEIDILDDMGRKLFVLQREEES